MVTAGVNYGLDLAADIAELKRERNAVILADNYQVREIQEVADFVGDLRLAQRLVLALVVLAERLDDPLRIQAQPGQQFGPLGVFDKPVGDAKPEDIAGAILYFAGPTSDYVTGQILSVSGGLTMAG